MTGQQLIDPDAPEIVRIATGDDLPAAAAIHAAGDVEQAGRMHPLRSPVPLDPRARQASALATLERLHAEDSRQIWVTCDRDQVIGVASAAFRGRHAHVQSFFITPERQQRGIGSGLLRQLLRAARDAGGTVISLQASDDPRALGLYLRLGLVPQPPNVVWAAIRPMFPSLPPDFPYEQIAIQSEDPATLNTIGDIDKAVRGVRREQDLNRWLAEGAEGALLVDRGSGKPAGYFLVSSANGAGRIGPVAAIDLPAFDNVLRAALVAASHRHGSATVWRAASPGENHAAIPTLLAAGFRPAFTISFMATAPVGQFDRYLFHDLDYL